MNYYNENDPRAAAWLRELMWDDLIPLGEVDERSIEDVRAGELVGYDQCHFFAGIGGWSYALRLAGWPDDRPVWTGSCPCQTHSSAARGRHTERDWWPYWYKLIISSPPSVIFGEQVAKAQRWLDKVADDLEALGYSFGAAILPAISVGQDHTRNRIYFAGHSNMYRQSSLQINAETSWLQRNGRESRVILPPNGLSDLVALRSGFGNAVVPELAAAFIQASES